MSEQSKLDAELSFQPDGAATTPIYYPLTREALASEIERLTERRNWVRTQAIIEAAQHISAFELGMLVKFEMLKWLECEEL